MEAARGVGSCERSLGSPTFFLPFPIPRPPSRRRVLYAVIFTPITELTASTNSELFTGFRRSKSTPWR